MLRFQLEPLKLIIDQVMDGVKKGWNEDGVEFKPDIDRYLYYSDIGYLRTYTARNEQAELVGHAGMYVSHSMRTGEKQAQEDYWYMTPKYRKGFNVLRLLRFVENDLKLMGVTKIMMTSKVGGKAGKILAARGYEHITNGFSKDL